MMTQQLGFSILTAPLAAIDRRALSQAWYSALHLASEGSATPQRVAPRATIGSDAKCAPNAAPSSPHVMPSAAMPRARSASRGNRIEGPPQERRAVRSPLARRIESVFLDPARRSERASFTIEGSRARIHVALQSSPAGLRLVAVCAPEVRPQVAKALDQVRYALAVRGIALRTDVAEVPGSC